MVDAPVLVRFLFGAFGVITVIISYQIMRRSGLSDNVVERSQLLQASALWMIAAALLFIGARL